MRIDVALLPGQSFDRSRSVCVVVDVLRASSTIVTLLDRGVARILPAADVDHARRLHRRFPDHLLCGEKDGLPPPGFDYGNSPAEFSRLDLTDRPTILATSNGTRVLASLADAPAVLVGCLLNRTAAARAALATTQDRNLDIVVVCCGAGGGSTFVLEDALGAGAIADAALDLNAALEPSDAARFARNAFRLVAEDTASAVASAYHAKELADISLAADVAHCARLDTSKVAPQLARDEDGTFVLTPYRA
jgi:2-phosphosulfolactate phosphatase